MRSTYGPLLARLSLLGTVSLGMLFTPLVPLRSVEAQESQRGPALPPLPIQFNPDNISNPGRPGGRRRGGGSRGGCAADGVPLTAIAYSTSEIGEELGVEVEIESVGSLTTQAQPLLWFYMPQAVSDDISAELIVKDETDEVLYRGQIEGRTNDNGIISVPMAVELAAGSAYHWFLSLECDEADLVRVDGWIARQNSRPEVMRLFAQAEPRNRAALYANYGYVQDALNELAAMRLADLDNEAIAQDWVGFLNSLGLEELTAAPILDCCEVAGVDVDRPRIEEREVVEPAEETQEAPRESVFERVRGREESPRDR